MMGKIYEKILKKQKQKHWPENWFKKKRMEERKGYFMNLSKHGMRKYVFVEQNFKDNSWMIWKI